ncbi:TerD family protein [Streptomyces griseoincarnatus]|uniref:TerD family protein n=1 Tax=Streptomyces griseoincarnatus TaxID=29305 RepID=A0ABT0VPN8_STRGI|nr:TerD family protein [Streptomyces griseoincarnatus]MCM2513315.1 TerD family protein [Streptomyces griseoincarnatus]
MAREFQRGHKARISDLTAGTDLYVGVQIAGPGLSFDISCFGLDADERLSDDRYFIFYNQPKSPEESVQLLGAQAGDTESFRVTLDRIPQQIKKLSFTATIDGAGQMSQIGPGYIRIVAGGEEVARYPFNGSEFTTERAVMLGDFYFKDVWRFAAVGQGFDGGLDALLRNFGGEVAEDEPAASEPQQAPQPQAAPGFAPPAQAAAPPAFGAPGGGAPIPAPAPAPQPAQGFAPPPAPAPAAPPVHSAPTIVAPMQTPPGGSPVPPPAPAPAPHGGQTPPPPPGYGQPPAPPQAPAPPPGYGLPPAAPQAPAPPPGYGMPPAAPQAPAPPPGYGQQPPPGQMPPGQMPHQQAPYGAPQGMPQGAPQAPGVLGALQQFKETPTGQRWTQQNKKLVRADLGIGGTPVLARQGSMVLYQGKVDFSYKGAGFTGRIVGNATGQEMQLMRCTGQGQVFFAENSTMLHPIELQGDAVCVSAENVLAFDEGLQYEVRRIEGHGIPGGALFTMQFQGTGTIVVKTHGIPVVLPVTPTTFADANAVVAWSAAAQVVVSSQVRMRRNSYPGATGESVNLQFRGAPGNFIVVQPYEI